MKKGVDYVGVGVGALIKNENNEYFLSKRGMGCRNEVGTWEFPGGGVEFGDSLEETIIREMDEEYNLKIKVLDLVKTVDHMIPNESQHWVAITFLCEIVSGEPHINEPDKCSQIGWFSLHEIESMNLSIISRDGFNWLKDHL
ncbi:NUDIX domain-containing protein [Patescibacteria group bacterium]|nr:NUDIX domain-containing protein [Patescibacteria group bacterium]